MKPLTLHPEAVVEVQEAVTYYESQRPGLGREFREDLEGAFSRIRQFPGVPAPINGQGTRKIRFQRFPYTVYYVELEQVIGIAAVAHQRRRPRYWRDRGPAVP